MKKQVISYSRFSSSKQSKGSSIERQREMFTDWLEKNKDSYFECELSRQDKGLSAYKKDNLKGGLGDILAAIESGRLMNDDAIVIEAMDRLSRADTLNAIEIVGKILRAGVVLITLEDNQEYTKESVNTAQFYLLTSKIQAAHDYSKKLGARVAAAWDRKREQAKNGTPPIKIHSIPLWIDKNTKKLNQHAPMIREVVEQYLSGQGIREIVYNLSRKYNYSLNDRNIARWLDNHNAMLGLWYGVQAFEALLTQEEFDSIQSMREKRRTTSKQPSFHATSGLVICSVCNGPFIFRVQKPAATKSAPAGSEEYKRKPKIVYGNCRNYLHHKACTNNATLPEEVALLVYSATSSEPLLEISLQNALEVLDRKIHAGLIERKRNTQREFDLIYDLYMRNPRLVKDRDLQRMEILKDELDDIDNKLEEQASKHAKVESLIMAKRRSNLEKFGTKGSLFAFNEVDGELMDAVDAEMEKLIANPFMKRMSLKNIGYRIFVHKEIRKDISESRYSSVIATLSTNNQEYHGHTWKIMKRSQKLGCYLVEHTWFDQVEDNFESQNSCCEDMNSCDEFNSNIMLASKSEIIQVRRD